ncbi:hypothetical protein MMC30_005332 [Trapelia coarctata]|nr:hypothetical protein [Trapelia coarctata]
MGELIRDTVVGFIVRTVTSNKALQFTEDRESFQLPESYLNPSPSRHEHHHKGPTVPATPAFDEVLEDVADGLKEGMAGSEDELEIEELEPVVRADTHVDLDKITSQSDLEKAFTNAALGRQPTTPIAPTLTSDGIILVDWYTTDDPENPQNWSFAKKNFVAFLICFYTFSVYIGSAIYTPSTNAVTEVFGVSVTAASLGLALYVLGYGTGPLIFSPLSEIPFVGRNVPYILTFGIFVILCVPTALVDNFAGLLVLRFLQGFFGSPCLATGGATFGDMYNILQLPFLMTFWVASATGGPSLGPIISGFSVPAENWRWSLWEMLWIAGPVFILLFIFLPETSADNILLRRAARLRKLTGNDKYRSQSEIDQQKLKTSTILVQALWKPTQITFLDPAITFATVYSSLTYGVSFCHIATWRSQIANWPQIYYSFFEAFPVVYIDLYGFNLGELGLTFLSIVAALVIAVPTYMLYLYVRVNPSIRANGLGPQEDRLIPALITSFIIPIGLFLFAWTSDGHIHWIVSVIGITIYTIGVFTVVSLGKTSKAGN